MPQTGETSSRPLIGRVSLLMIGITAFMMAGIVAAYLHLWLDKDNLKVMIESEILEHGTIYNLTSLSGTAGRLICAVPALLSLWGLWNAMRLFLDYRRGAIFTETAGRRLKHMGLALALLPIVQIALTASLSLLFTIDNPVGQRHLSITLTQTHLLVGVTGGMLIVIGWVMAEAMRIADDNRQIV